MPKDQEHGNTIEIVAHSLMHHHYTRQFIFRTQLDRIEEEFKTAVNGVRHALM
jgi:hypothetical protein